MQKLKKHLEKTCLMVLLIALLIFPMGNSSVLQVHAYDEPIWNMSFLYASTHYTDGSGKAWYPPTAFYLPQFDTMVENTDGKSTYYKTSKDGGQSWDAWNNHNIYAGYLTPDEPPDSGTDRYYQFAGLVTNSDPSFNNQPYYSGKFYIDDKSPNISFSPICNAGSSQPITVTFGANDTGAAVPLFDGDTGSGLDHYVYRVSSDNGSTWGDWSSDFTSNDSVTFSNSGAYQIEVRAWDHVGNEADEISGSYIINNTSAGASVTAGSYHTNTDVITSVTVTNTGGDITPDTGASVTFSIPGITSQSKGFVLPAGASELVWFRWHTPSTPQTVTANISVNAGSTANMSPSFDIEDLTEKTPPHPKSTDRANAFFQYTTPPNFATTSSASWASYSAHQEARTGQIWDDAEQQYDTYTYYVWVFTTNSYYALLNSTLSLTPDSYDPTATESYGEWSIKSGYGFQEHISSSVSTNDSGAVTGVQNAVSYYPEFMYNDTGYSFGGFDRVFEMLSGGLNSAFDLKANPYSVHGQHVHFTPVWFANGQYEPTTLAMDCWTPAGELTAQNSAVINIQGSVFDDWYPKASP